jgi:hypothetical protein
MPDEGLRHKAMTAQGVKQLFTMPWRLSNIVQYIPIPAGMGPTTKSTKTRPQIKKMASLSAGQSQ